MLLEGVLGGLEGLCETRREPATDLPITSEVAKVARVAVQEAADARRRVAVVLPGAGNGSCVVRPGPIVGGPAETLRHPRGGGNRTAVARVDTAASWDVARRVAVSIPVALILTDRGSRTLEEV